MPPKPHRPFRILALPLARLPGPVTSVPPKPKSPLILYQVLQPERPSSKSTTTAGTGTGAGPDAKPPPKEPLLNRALARASDEWLKLGTKPAGSWMLWFYQRGESLMDRIEYEEWALKSIQEGRGVRINKDGQPEERIEVSNVVKLSTLHRLLMHRIPYHRKMMWRSLAFSPVTWPFALIPIIPNFPLFYVLWRAWSHWKAYRGATYLEQLLKSGLIVEKPSLELTQVYRSRGI
ncbi:mitochondrial K+-H+ exchange-related-domain-containing protein, partial [Naematelia encephala]